MAALDIRSLIHAGSASALRSDVGAAAAGAWREPAGGSTALHWAAGYGHLAVCRWLVEQCGCDPCARCSKHGRAPLHLAARWGHLHICRWLVEDLGTTADARAKHGVTPFQLAVWQGHERICRWLISGHNVDPKQCNDFGCGAMHWAALCPVRPETLVLPEFLLRDCGLDFELRNRQGHSPLHKAAWAGNRRFCCWLRDAVGLRDGAVDNAGNFAADMAAMAGHPEVARWLRLHCSAARVVALETLGLPPKLLDAASDEEEDDGHGDGGGRVKRTKTSEISAIDDAQTLIRRAYLDAALRTHPDKQCSDASAWEQVQHAYATLANRCQENHEQHNARHRYRLVLTAMADSVTARSGRGPSADETSRACQDGNDDGATLATQQLPFGDLSRVQGAPLRSTPRSALVSLIVGAGTEACITSAELATKPVIRLRKLAIRAGLPQDAVAAAATAGLAELKAEVVAVLFEYPNGMPLATLPKKYGQIWRRAFPASTDFGFKKVSQFLRGPDFTNVIVVEQVGPNHTVLRPSPAILASIEGR